MSKIKKMIIDKYGEEAFDKIEDFQNDLDEKA